MKVASIATYADRLEVLPDAVKSLAGQVDVIHIYYNGKADDSGYKQLQVKLISECGDMGGEVAECLVETVKDKADLSKFRAIWDYPDATIFLCDDDLIYDENYAYRMNNNLHFDHMVGADVVTLGGKIIGDGRKFKRDKDYNKCFSQKIKCTTPTSKSDEGGGVFNFAFAPVIDVPLSGCTILEAKDFQDCEIDERYKYAADIQLAKWISDKGLTCKRAWNYGAVLCRYQYAKMQGKETIFNNHTKKRGRELYEMVAEFATVK